MNKYILIGIAVLVLLGGGVAYRSLAKGEGTTQDASGNVVNIKLIAVKDEWRWEPERFEVKQGDRIVMEVVNEDNYDHGIAIDALGISQRMPANSTITVEFVASQEGDFPFYCSVPCGEGTVEQMKRTHFDMIGRLKVSPR